MEEESISHLNSLLARHLELVEGQTCDPIKLRENSGLIREGYKKTKLGWIPKDWEVVKFNKIASFNPKSESLPESFIYIDLESVKDGILQKRTILKKDDAPSRAQRVLKKNDVLFQTVRPYQKNNLFFQEEGDFVASTGYAQIRAKYNSRFIFHLIQVTYFNNQVLARCTGTSFPAISAKDLSNVLIKLPTLPEQQKIATILSSWDRAIAKQEQLITAKQEFKKGLMQLLLPGKKRFEGFEGEWESKTLNECCSVKGKYGINAAAVPYKTELPRYLRITDIDDSGNYSPEKEVSVDDPTWSEYVLEDGDIVFARTGNTTGKTYLYDSADGELVFAGFLIKFKPDPRKLNPYFLKYFTNSTAYWKWVEVMSVRSGQPGINSNEYGKLNIKLPSLTEQQKIASVLSAADKEIGLLQSELARLRGQKRGLMQVLLTGKKRVQL